LLAGFAGLGKFVEAATATVSSFSMWLTGFSYAAKLVAIQGGISIYTASSSRLLAGYRYQYINFIIIHYPNQQAVLAVRLEAKSGLE